MHSRQLLEADQTQIVNPAGPAPWRSFQEAYDHLLRNIDLAGRTFLLHSLVPVTGDLVACGHPGSGGKVVVIAPAWSAGAIVAKHGACLHVQGVTLNDVPLYASKGGHLSFNWVEFGPSSRGHVEAHDGGHVECLGHYSITGGAPYHLHATSRATMTFDQGGGWLAGALVFEHYFVGCSSGDVTWGLGFAYHLAGTVTYTSGRKALFHNGGNGKTLRQGTPEYETFLPGAGEITTQFGNSVGWYT